VRSFGSLVRMELAHGAVATAAKRAKATLLQRLARRGAGARPDVYVQQWLGAGAGPHARL